jgi:hypothetical protein
MRSLLLATGLLVIAALLSGVSTAALAADCGGVVPCACGDSVVAHRTLVQGEDAVLATPCPDIALFVDGGVHLNLGGGTIRGVGPGFCGIRTLSGTVIEGGTITGFSTGIEGNGVHNLAFGVRVRAVRLVGNRIGISLAGGGNTIEQCQVSRNTVAGILLVGGLLEDEPETNRVRSCRVEDNGGDGIFVDSSAVVVDAVVERNHVRRNAGYGISAPEGRTTVALNRVEDNRRGGITVSPAQPPQGTNSVLRNIVLRNGVVGIEVSGLAEAPTTVDRNQAKYTEGPGITINGPSLVSGNIAQVNDVGLDVSGEGSTLSRNVASYNVLFGIVDSSAGTGNTYRNNICRGNGIAASEPPGLCR